MEWKELTIKQAQYIYQVNKSIVDDQTSFEARLKIFSYLTNTPEEIINGWEVEDYKKELGKISFLNHQLTEECPVKSFTTNGAKYKVLYDIRKIGYGRYMQLTKRSDDIVFNLHKIMAAIVMPSSIFKRKKSYERICEEMLQAPFIVCYHTAVYFSKLYNNSLKAIHPYLKQDLIKNGMSTTDAETIAAGLVEISDEFNLKNRER